MSNHVIQLHKVGKAFRSRGNKNLITGLWRPEWKYKNAIEDVSFDVRAGEAVAFLGPNGAGKTTTTKMMTGLIAATTGSVRVLGKNPFERQELFLKSIGLVMGNKAGLNWDLSARQAFELLAKMYDITPDRKNKQVAHMSEILGVKHVLDTQIRKTSLGERMKLELIGALLHDPKVLFLDEPTIGLDIPSKLAMRKFLKQLHKEEGKTLILTSHDMDDVSDICERVIIINKGLVVVDEPMHHLTNAYKNMRSVSAIFEGDYRSIKFANHIKITKSSSAKIIFEVPKEDLFQTLDVLNRQVVVLDLAIEQISLETIIAEKFER